MLRVYFALWLCLMVGRLKAFPTVVRRGTPSDNPTAANFVRRAAHGSIVLGDFVLIDGGEFSQLVDGVLDFGQSGDSEGPYSRQNNYTLSIDLRKPWTNSTVVIKIIPKNNAPVLNIDTLWADPDGKSCYLWSGEWSQLIKSPAPSSNSLWKFTSDAEGGGTWSQEPIDFSATSHLSQHLLRPGRLGFGTTIGDVGYQIGGQVWGQSDNNSSPLGFFTSKITSYNMSSVAWNNDKNTHIGSAVTIGGASAQTLSASSSDGRELMVIFGGRDLGTDVNVQTTTYFELDSITIYDPYIDVWFSQQATGEIPAIREQFCAVTVRGNNGTYEIFVYGGINELTYQVYDDVYILSIPGFVWFKVPDPAPPPRYWHTCELVRNRQLLSIGGIVNPDSCLMVFHGFSIPDPFAQGLGIFDTTDLIWKPSYDPTAPPYESPQTVRDWYSQGNLASVKWQSLQLARMFIPDDPVSVSPAPATTASGSPITTTTTTTTAQAQTDSQDDKTIGLSVGLGIPGFLATAAGAWIAWKQYRRSKTTQPLSSNDSSHASSGDAPNMPSNTSAQRIQPGNSGPNNRTSDPNLPTDGVHASRSSSGGAVTNVQSPPTN